MTVIAGWTLLPNTYNDRHTWQTADGRVRLWRGGDHWRCIGMDFDDIAQLEAAGIKPTDNRNMTLNELVQLVSDTIGCDTHIKQEDISYVIEGTHLSLGRDGIDDRCWYLRGTDEHEHFHPVIEQAYEPLMHTVFGSRADALIALNNELIQLEHQ